LLVYYECGRDAFADAGFDDSLQSFPQIATKMRSHLPRQETQAASQVIAMLPGNREGAGGLVEIHDSDLVLIGPGFA
jgi:hypothetical protein